MDHIHIKGAREHNLKNLDLSLPRNQLVVITGLSGSGKSSLAFDTLYAEGQRRYVESLSAYARQFLDQMEKPDVDSIEGLSPAISIEQKTTSRNPRSTVATVTEIYDYLRLLYARTGKPACVACGRPIASQTIQEMADQILARPEGTKLQILAPVVRGRKGEYKKLLQDLMKRGYIRARVNGQMLDLTEGVPDLDKQKKHTIEVVIDRLKVSPSIQSRLADSLEIACNLAEGGALVDVDGVETHFSSKLACSDAACARFGQGLLEQEPRSFSFNSPYGACPTCDGLGFKRQFAEELIIPNPELSISEGAIQASGWKSVSEDGWRSQMLDQLSRKLKFSLDTPWKKLGAPIRRLLLHGTDKEMRFTYESKRNRYDFVHHFEGIIGNLQRRYNETTSEEIQAELEQSMRVIPCEACQGQRLKPEVLAVTVEGLNIAQVTAQSVRDARAWFSKLGLQGKEAVIAEKVLKEIQERLGFLDDVGLGYLTLDRSAATLSGGESQRIRLATQIGSKLQGVLYVLDEPSIGLHQRDNLQLIRTLQEMRDLGNTVLVVEHDLETILAADHVVDMGPGAGEHGGHVVAQGTPQEQGLHHRRLPGRARQHSRGPPPPQGHAGTSLRGGCRGEQPQEGGRGLPPGPGHLRHGRQRLGQEHAGERDPLQGPGEPAAPGRARGGQAQGHQGARGHRQGHRHRPGPHRPHAPQQPRHLHGPLHAPARALRPAAREQGPGLRTWPLQLQREGRPL